MSDDRGDNCFVIEPNTPPPDSRVGRMKYPRDQLEVGFSLKTRASPGALRQAVRRFKLQHPDAGRFTVRDWGGGYSRVYRLT